MDSHPPAGLLPPYVRRHSQPARHEGDEVVDRVGWVTAMPRQQDVLPILVEVLIKLLRPAAVWTARDWWLSKAVGRAVWSPLRRGSHTTFIITVFEFVRHTRIVPLGLPTNPTSGQTR